MIPAPGERQECILRVNQMVFSYPERQMFAQWSRQFGAGLTWIRGHNGNGKSTLLKLLGGALVPHAGAIIANGKDAVRDPLAYRQQVFWCGPGAIPFDHLSPLEYFGFMRGLYPGFDDTALSSHVDAFSLRPHLRGRLCTLSTGTQRKVWISAALSAGTAVTLLDEPVNALDAAAAMHLLAVLNERACDAGRACIVASHQALGLAAQAATVIELSAAGVY